MKTVVLVLGLFLTANLSVSAQQAANHSLTIIGSVQGIEAKCFGGESSMGLRLFVQFRNDGEIPLLLIKPTYPFTTKIYFVNDRFGDPTVSQVSADVATSKRPYTNFSAKKIPDAEFDAMEIDDLIKRLDTAEPSITLDPGRYLEIQSTVCLKNGFKVEARQRDGHRAEEKPIPLYSSFYLEYHLSLKNYDRGRDLFETLQNRWRRFGNLVLDENGDITYRSEEITLNPMK